MTPTQEQATIIEAVRCGGPSLMISALAGCTKTSTIEMASPYIKGVALALAFNVKNKEDLAKRLPPNINVKNFNGLGHTAFSSSIGRRCALDDNKLTRLLRTIVGNEAGREAFTDTLALVRAARIAGLVPAKFPQKGLIPDVRESWEELALGEGIDLAGEVLDWSHQLLVATIKESYAGTIDFDDQIYMSALFAGSFPRYETVIVDEAQDLSPLNHRQVAKLRPKRLIVVGDPNQAIYAFRGADSKSMESLRALMPEWQDLTLTTSFRCSKAVVGRQNTFLPLFRAAETNKEGEVRDLRHKKWTWEDMPKAGSVAVLCRNNAPLISLALKLLVRGIPVSILGRDIGKNLIKLLDKLAKPADSIGEVHEKVLAWRTKEVSKAEVLNQQSKISGINDRAEALLALIESSEAQLQRDLVATLHTIFSSPAGDFITLATGHKAKGLEWDNVLHLNPHLIPSKYARVMAEAGNDAPLRQDLNLRYVIETRTKDILLLAHLDDFEKDPDENLPNN